MSDDPRCCGSGTCIIDPEGRCWCGQVWNGHEMCSPALKPPAVADTTGDAGAKPTDDQSSDGA